MLSAKIVRPRPGLSQPVALSPAASKQSLERHVAAALRSDGLTLPALLAAVARQLADPSRAATLLSSLDLSFALAEPLGFAVESGGPEGAGDDGGDHSEQPGERDDGAARGRCV
jgi:hypothetical protein